MKATPLRLRDALHGLATRNEVVLVEAVRRQFGFFAKYWQPGCVKTRLAASIGDEPASLVYRAFVKVIAKRLHGCADRHVLAYTPAERREEFLRAVGNRWTLIPQGGGDLGVRMRGYFAEAIEQGCQKVILIGSDSPTLPSKFVAQAFALLDEVPVVMGPTCDGGYYLLGTRGPVPPIFDGIQWSSLHVWQQTVSRLEQAKLEFGELPMWYDVDRKSDLNRLQQELAGNDQSSVWRDLRRLVERHFD